MRGLIKYLFSLLLSSAIHGQGTYSAVILDFSNKVSCQGRKLFVGSSITDRDSILIGKNSSVRILEENGIIREVTSSFRLKPNGKENRLRKIFESGESLLVWAKRRVNEGVSRGSSVVDVDLKSPRNTALLESPEWLTWETASHKESFQLFLRCYENDFAKEVKVQGRKYSLDSKQIESGRKYYWQIGDETENLAWFRVLGRNEIINFRNDINFLNDVLGKDTVGISYLLLKTQICLNFELHQDALACIRAVLQRDPENSVANRQLARVYDALNLIDESINSLRLSMKFEN